MGDFERIFGAGANIESIVDSINDEHLYKYKDDSFEQPIMFNTFKEALEWAKQNIGEIIIRDSNMDCFIVKSSRIDTVIPASPIMLRDTNGTCVGDALEKFKPNTPTWQDVKYSVPTFGVWMEVNIPIRLSHIVGLESALRDSGFGLWHITDNMYFVTWDEYLDTIYAALLVQSNLITITADPHKISDVKNAILGRAVGSISGA